MTWMPNLGVLGASGLGVPAFFVTRVSTYLKETCIRKYSVKMVRISCRATPAYSSPRPERAM